MRMPLFLLGILFVAWVPILWPVAEAIPMPLSDADRGNLPAGPARYLKILAAQVQSQRRILVETSQPPTKRTRQRG